MRLSPFCQLFLTAQPVLSQSVVRYKKTHGLLDISPYVFYLADTTRSLTFEQVQKLPYAAFSQNKKTGLNLRNQDLPHWFSIDLADTTFSVEIRRGFCSGCSPLRDLAGKKTQRIVVPTSRKGLERL